MLTHPAALRDAAERAGAYLLAFYQDITLERALLEALKCRETSFQWLEIPDPRKVGGRCIHGLEGMEKG